MEHLVKQVAVDQNEFVLELLVLSFYYRCAMQETVCYQECPTETLPVPTFFLEAVSDIGCLLTDATGPDGKPTDLFWRELIEWGLSRTTYETIFINNNGDSTMAPVTDLLLQGAHVVSRLSSYFLVCSEEDGWSSAENCRNMSVSS